MTLNPKDAPAGYKAVEGRSSENMCSKCAFSSYGPACQNARCTAEEREDGREVYFVPDGSPIPTSLLEQAIALLKEIDIVPSTDWADRRARLIQQAKDHDV